MKTICIYHKIDLDGWMSAAIVKHWFETIDNEQEKQTGQSQRQYHQRDFVGYNYGQPIPDLSEYDKVIMCDISFPKEEMLKLSYKLEWIDHHISAIKDIEVNEFIGGIYKGLRDTKFAACELTWQYFFPNELMPEIVRLLGRYDCFGHKGTDEEQKVLEFQYGARQCISNYEEAYKYLKIELNSYLPNPNNYDREENPIYKIWNSGKSIYQYLCTEAKQTCRKAFPIELFEQIDLTDESMNYPKRSFLCVNQERFNPINFGIDYHKDGYDGFACFWYKDGNWHFSLYNDNGEVDCSAIAKSFGGGGHKGAAGFRIENINDFLNETIR